MADEALAYLPPIDVLVLGMGDDGHCASLFAGNPQLDEALLPGNTTRCVPMLAPGVPHQRISMTYALLATANVQFLAVQGAGKVDTLQQVVSDLGATSAMPVRAFMRPHCKFTGARRAKDRLHVYDRTTVAAAHG